MQSPTQSQSTISKTCLLQTKQLTSWKPLSWTCQYYNQQQGYPQGNRFYSLLTLAINYTARMNVKTILNGLSNNIVRVAYWDVCNPKMVKGSRVHCAKQQTLTMPLLVTQILSQVLWGSTPHQVLLTWAAANRSWSDCNLLHWPI